VVKRMSENRSGLTARQLFDVVAILADYAFDNGFHELGYDPICEIAELMLADKKEMNKLYDKILALQDEVIKLYEERIEMIKYITAKKNESTNNDQA
jgi:hypothetical protein